MSLLPTGWQYRGLDKPGGRACERRLRQRFRKVEKLADPESVRLREAARAATADEPDAAYGARHLMLAALDAAEGVGCTWAQAMEHLLRKFDERADQTEAPA